MKKSKVLLSAVLVMALCVSLIAGTTFALFTSESGVNIAVTAGTVDVAASVKAIATKQDKAEVVNGKAECALNNGGLAKVDGNEVTFEGFTPGEEVTLTLGVTNNSTVIAKYRSEVSCKTDGGLFKALKVNYNGSNVWRTVNPKQAIDDVSVTVSFPEAENNNDYQGKSCVIAVNVSAVQGNAETDSEVLKAFDFSDPAQSAAFCPDCYNNKEHTEHNSGLTVENGKASFTKEGAWYASENLNLTECYYQLSYNVDVSELANGEAVVFNQGENKAWASIGLGIINDNGVFKAHKTLDANQCTDANFLGEVDAQFNVTVEFKQIGEKFFIELSVEGLTDTVKTQSAAQNPAVYWDIYNVSQNASAAIDNFELAEFKGFADESNLAEALKGNAIVKLTKDVEKVSISNDVENAVIDANGKTLNNIEIEAGTNAVVTVKNAVFAGNNENSANAVNLSKSDLSGKITFEKCAFGGYDKAVQVGGDNGAMSLEFDGCTFNCGKTGAKTYGFQGFANYDEVIIKNCAFNDCVSWAILIQGEINKVIIDNNTFTNCQSGVFKTTGTVKAFTFKNNTLVNTQGHDGNSNQYFSGALTYVDCVNNTKDGAEWIVGK